MRFENDTDGFRQADGAGTVATAADEMILVVVLPTFNEVGSLARIATELLELKLRDIEVRLLIVDDASSDGTAALADDLARRSAGRIEVLHRRNKRGLGSAYIDGFTKALADGADLVAQMDADLSHDPSTLVAMAEAIRDADLVVGSRYIEGAGVDPHWGWHRKLLSRWVNRAVVPALLCPLASDATSGYRLWRCDVLARIAPSANVRSTGYAFQVEMAYLAHRLGSRIKEVPIHFRERESGRSKMNVWVALIAAREVLRIRRELRL